MLHSASLVTRGRLTSASWASHDEAFRSHCLPPGCCGAEDAGGTAAEGAPEERGGSKEGREAEGAVRDGTPGGCNIVRGGY